MAKCLYCVFRVSFSSIGVKIRAGESIEIVMLVHVLDVKRANLMIFGFCGTLCVTWQNWRTFCGWLWCTGGSRVQSVRLVRILYQNFEIQRRNWAWFVKLEGTFPLHCQLESQDIPVKKQHFYTQVSACVWCMGYLYGFVLVSMHAYIIDKKRLSDERTFDEPSTRHA